MYSHQGVNWIVIMTCKSREWMKTGEILRNTHILNVSILQKYENQLVNKFRAVQSISCNYLEPDTFSPHPMALRHFNIILPSMPSLPHDLLP
jgi:hypothetical protein